MQVMGDIPGVPGLFVAGVFSGALSTVSSGLNSLAAVCLKDFIASGCNIKLSDEKQTVITKVLAGDTSNLMISKWCSVIIFSCVWNHRLWNRVPG